MTAFHAAAIADRPRIVRQLRHHELAIGIGHAFTRDTGALVRRDKHWRLGITAAVVSRTRPTSADVEPAPTSIRIVGVKRCASLAKPVTSRESVHGATPAQGGRTSARLKYVSKKYSTPVRFR